MQAQNLGRWLGLCALVTLIPQVALSQTASDSNQSSKDLAPRRLIPPPCNSFTMQTAPTLGWHQKFCYYAENKVLTGSGLFGSLFFAGVAQLRHDPEEWGQGAEGYGKRFGTRYAQGLAKSTAEFLFGAINQEDPRPQPPPNPDGTHSHIQSSIKGRIGAALLRTVWTHRDNGKDFIAFSRIAGALTSGFIGNAWYPDRLSTTGQAFARTGSAFGGYVMNSLFSEFQSEVFRLLRKLMGLSPKQPAATPSRSRP